MYPTADHRNGGLTTEMGEGRGCENSQACPAVPARPPPARQPHPHAQKAIKLIYCPCPQPSKDDIRKNVLTGQPQKCSDRHQHCLMSGPQKWGMPAPRPRAKRTLNVLYRLTTEMGEGRGWENREQYQHAHPGKDDIRKNVRPADHRNVAPAKAQKGIKLIYCPWGGGRDLVAIFNLSLVALCSTYYLKTH